MTEKKKMGRPPASWMFSLAHISPSKPWMDAYEIAELFGLNIKTVKSHLSKLKIIPKHVIKNGKAKAQFKTKELRTAAKIHIEPWM